MKAKDIRKGTVIMYNKAPHRVLDFQHRTPGNLRAFVQATLRNVLSGIQCDTRFSSTEDLETADVFNLKGTYLYTDDLGSHFMNSETYEQVTLSAELVGEGRYYLQDGMSVDIMTFDDRPIGVSFPKTVILTVVDTQPELKGATASNSPKPATTDTGLTLNVPAFVKIGEKIIVDTTTGEYLSRAE
ncbi:elongation factor P [bacterium]|nr:elongation factor P [bacterium]